MVVKLQINQLEGRCTQGSFLLTVSDIERQSTIQRSAIPVRLAGGKWNCSVPYWADFRQHFLCNLNQECAGMEDEADCPYTTDLCVYVSFIRHH
nr:hypothetical protein BaRGS_026864 [Batillaria attramentaria]